MYIKDIYLENFRNYVQEKIEFDQNINIVYGNNAQGKTNIIEAIYLCSLGKSFRAKKDKDLIKFNEEFSNIKINYYKENRVNSIDLKINDKKQFTFNGIKQNKVSDIVGKLNIVTFTPDDINIIKNGPEERRKFLNMMISSLRPKYLHSLNQYNKVLEERNNLLKQIENNRSQESLLDIYDEQLAILSQEIYIYRNEYVNKIKEKIEDIHKMITKSGNLEDIKIKYISSGHDKESYLEAIKKSRSIDIKRGYSAVGIHRDDLLIYINHKPVGVFGSQRSTKNSNFKFKTM